MILKIIFIPIIYRTSNNFIKFLFLENKFNNNNSFVKISIERNEFGHLLKNILYYVFNKV